MYKKEIERKWLVKLDKLPDLSKYPMSIIKTGFLSQLHDSLMVRVRNIDDEEYSLDLKDSGTKIRNEITYKISKDEYDISFSLAGQKTLTKRRFKVPSSKDSSRILEVDVFQDIDLILVEYEADDEALVDSVFIEPWFDKEVTDDFTYTNIQLAYKKV